MEIIVNSLEDLPAAAEKIAPLLRGRGVVALYGGMGAGKTTLISALVRALGSPDEVTSPTFALVNDYVAPAVAPPDAAAPVGDALPTACGDDGERGERHIYHFDFYRIDDIREAFDLGYEEYFYSGELCLVEWPEKIEPLLPADTLRLQITLLPSNSRRITITP
jgi:tRNA threonylcarbamoyladenosine biosynthesis protein TsaE